MFRILIIEDDRSLEDVISQLLRRYNYIVQGITDFKDIENQISRIQADLILLDINLPYLDGFYLCRYIRKHSTVPIIIISARSGDTEQVMGMELGADDYLVKPFNTEVLLAKVKASLRRAYGEYHQEQHSLISFGEIYLNRDQMKMYYQGKEILLTKMEYKLLSLLFESKEKVVTREEILLELWDDTIFVDDNTLTVNVSRVKHKLEELGIKDAIKTKRGVGYYLDSAAVVNDGDS